MLSRERLQLSIIDLVVGFFGEYQRCFLTIAYCGNLKVPFDDELHLQQPHSLVGPGLDGKERSFS